MASHSADDPGAGVRRPDRDATVRERIRRWTDLDAVRWAALGVAASLIGFGVWWHSPAVVPEEVLPRASDSSTEPQRPGTTAGGGAAESSVPGVPDAPGATVHVVGAVQRPGLVDLEPGQRIADAIELAGGPTGDADLHRLNLATIAIDGMRIAVPTVGDPTAAGALVEIPQGESHGASGAPHGLVDVNRAGAAELETLTGIGPATAAAIIEHRDEHGPFASIDRLTEVPGIGPVKLDAIRDAIVVGQ